MNKIRGKMKKRVVLTWIRFVFNCIRGGGGGGGSFYLNFKPAGSWCENYTVTKTTSKANPTYTTATPTTHRRQTPATPTTPLFIKETWRQHAAMYASDIRIGFGPRGAYWRIIMEVANKHAVSNERFPRSDLCRLARRIRDDPPPDAQRPHGELLVIEPCPFPKESEFAHEEQRHPTRLRGFRI